jgi:hypothetical protein
MDRSQRTYVSRKDTLELLEQHVYENIVRINGQ